MNICMTGHAGDLASKRLFKDHESEIKARFSNSFVNKILELPDEKTNLGSEASCSEVCIRIEEGLYKSLWNLGETLGTGLEVEHWRIPIKQEIVEVCELLEINPYEIESSGAIYVLPEGEFPLEGTLIGKTTHSNDRVVRMKNGTRFINKK